MIFRSNISSYHDDSEDLRIARRKLNYYELFFADIQKRSGLEEHMVKKILDLITADDNELITNQIKQLMSTARLVYSEELQAYHQELVDAERAQELAYKKQMAEEAKRVQELDKLNDENVERQKRNKAIIDANLQLMNQRIQTLISKYRDPGVEVDRAHKLDLEELRIISHYSDGKLELVRSGFLWSWYKVEGPTPVIDQNSGLYQYYLGKDIGDSTVEALVPIPNQLFISKVYHDHYAMMMAMDRNIVRYFKDSPAI